MEDHVYDINFSVEIQKGFFGSISTKRYLIKNHSLANSVSEGNLICLHLGGNTPPLQLEVKNVEHHSGPTELYKNTILYCSQRVNRIHPDEVKEFEDALRKSDSFGEVESFPNFST